MGSLADYIAEQKEQEQYDRDIARIEAAFKQYLSWAKINTDELSFWLWFIENKEKIARNKRLIDLIG